MAYPTPITNFAQSVYLTIKNRYFDDIAGVDGQEFITQVIDWFNGYLDELESVVDPYGKVVNWDWLREMNADLGTVALGDTSLDLDTTILSVIATPFRPVLITKNNTVVSKWAVVTPDQLGQTAGLDSVTKVGDALFFSRAIKDTEDGGTVTADITTAIPRVSATNAEALTLVKPKQLLILGVAKNASLPDIVQGGLSPSFTQKYNDLLAAAIVLSNATSTADMVDREDFGFVGGVGFL